MAKDPAFPLYTQDFLVGTMFFNDTEVGIYIRLLCVQHQHGGLIDKLTFNDKTKEYPKVKSKFIETDDGFFNERLMMEMEKRAIKSNNLSDNAKQRWDKVKQMQCKSNAKLMPSEDENEIENEIENSNKKVPEIQEFLDYCKTLSIYHPSFDFQIKAKYQSWIENKWKDGNNKPIKNWKTKIQNVMPYFKKDMSKVEAKVSPVNKTCVYCGKKTTTVISGQPVCNYEHLTKYQGEK